MKSLAILIAEDEVLTRSDIRGMLERAGHVVCGECDNGRQAVELAKQLSPDLALLDIMMPELDGIETAKILYGMNIPAVMLTAYSQPHIINRAENVHVCGYLVKPVSEQNLQATIRIAHARWQDILRVKRELADTREQLAQQKIISRAKTILVGINHVSEQEAHQQMIREAMAQRIPLIELARRLVEGHAAVAINVREKKISSTAKKKKDYFN
ncbi:MAG: response regulator [Veillonellaceae bacterium]|nr:response regulator [Veillonellaceae bacterium]